MADDTQRLLTVPLAQQKCRLGQGTDCCSYLTFDADGFACGLVTDLWSLITERRLAGTMRAKGGPCSDPLDDTSVAIDAGAAEPTVQRINEECARVESESGPAGEASDHPPATTDARIRRSSW